MNRTFDNFYDASLDKLPQKEVAGYLSHHCTFCRDTKKSMLKGPDIAYHLTWSRDIWMQKNSSFLLGNRNMGIAYAY